MDIDGSGSKGTTIPFTSAIFVISTYIANVLYFYIFLKHQLLACSKHGCAVETII